MRGAHAAARLLLLWAAASCRDPGDCLDVYDVRVCYAAAGEARVAHRDRARPPGGGPFRCQGDHCEQRYARLPDDGFWECVDLDGAVVCRGGEPSAGMIAGPPDVGWTCGLRASQPSERICVDLAPDLPYDDRTGWRCRYEHTGGEHRSCTRDAHAPKLGAACARAADCAAGARCVGARCVPPRPAPSCWLASDCKAGQSCRYGSCVGLDG